MATTDAVQDQINAILQRLSALDGQGLIAPAQGQVESLTAQLNGLKKTLGNVNMGYKSDLAAVQSDLNSFKTLVSSILGIQPASGS